MADMEMLLWQVVQYEFELATHVRILLQSDVTIGDHEAAFWLRHFVYVISPF